MFKISVIIPLLIILQSKVLFAQNAIEWDGQYQLQFSDFQSPTSAIDGGTLYSLYTGSNVDFSYQMTNAQFAFTKHFNDKVICTFKRSSASLVAPDSARAVDLLMFARYAFDLSELHARKLRYRLYEAKGAFSNANFFQPIYDTVEKENAEQYVLASRITDLGHDRQKLAELHQQVLNEIQEYADFCKTCKPPKKKK